MINYHKELVSALKSVLPTYYEMALTSKTATPCISYMENNNYTSHTGDTIGYSVISYQVKVWGNSIGVVADYATQADKALREIGFKRVSSTELYDNSSTMLQKIMIYEAVASEKY